MKKRPSLQAIILVSTGVFALGFIVFLLIGLSQFEGHSPSEYRAMVKRGSLSGSTPTVSRRSSRGGPTTPEEVARVNLHHLLMRLQRTSAPALRKKIIERALPRIDEFEEPLAVILDDPHDDLVVPAMHLAAGLELKQLARRLLLLADADSVRVQIAALVTKEILDPWSASELGRILEYSRDSKVLTIALRIVADRNEQRRPVVQLIKLLSNRVAAVRNAAADAMPETLTDEHLNALCALARAEGTEPGCQRAAARALGQTSMDETAETCLVDLLKHDDWIVRRSSLDSLAKKSSRLRSAEPVLVVIRDEKRCLQERVFGLVALERTATVPSEQIKSILPGLHPVLQMFASRCLLVAGDSSAIPVLIRLLDTKEGGPVDFDDFRCTTKESRAMLVEIAGKDLGPTSEPWNKWLRERTDIRPTATRRTPPTFWSP